MGVRVRLQPVIDQKVLLGLHPGVRDRRHDVVVFRIGRITAGQDGPGGRHAVLFPFRLSESGYQFAAAYGR